MAPGASDFLSLSFLKGSLSSRSFSSFTPSSQWIKAVTYSRVTSGPDSLLWLQILGNFIQRNDFRYFCFLITLNSIPSTLTCSKNSKHIHLIAAFQWVPLGIGNLMWSKQISRFVPQLSTMAFSLIFSYLPFFLPSPTLPCQCFGLSPKAGNKLMFSPKAIRREEFALTWGKVSLLFFFFPPPTNSCLHLIGRGPPPLGEPSALPSLQIPLIQKHPHRNAQENI